MSKKCILMVAGYLDDFPVSKVFGDPDMQPGEVILHDDKQWEILDRSYSRIITEYYVKAIS